VRREAAANYTCGYRDFGAQEDVDNLSPRLTACNTATYGNKRAFMWRSIILLRKQRFIGFGETPPAKVYSTVSLRAAQAARCGAVYPFQQKIFRLVYPVVQGQFDH
jgi:hypothetical protein